MVVDTDNMSDVLMNEKDDIAIISPGPLSSDSMDSVTDIVRADDCTYTIYIALAYQSH